MNQKQENLPAGSLDAAVQALADGLMQKWWTNPLVWEGGATEGRGNSPGCLMCPALKWDFPKQGSPIRASIRMQMKVFANQIHLLLFVCEMRVNTVLGSRKLMGPGRPHVSPPPGVAPLIDAQTKKGNLIPNPPLLLHPVEAESPPTSRCPAIF